MNELSSYFKQFRETFLPKTLPPQTLSNAPTLDNSTKTRKASSSATINQTGLSTIAESSPKFVRTERESSIAIPQIEMRTTRSMNYTTSKISSSSRDAFFATKSSSASALQAVPNKSKRGKKGRVSMGGDEMISGGGGDSIMSRLRKGKTGRFCI